MTIVLCILVGWFLCGAVSAYLQDRWTPGGRYMSLSAHVLWGVCALRATLTTDFPGRNKPRVQR